MHLGIRIADIIADTGGIYIWVTLVAMRTTA